MFLWFPHKKATLLRSIDLDEGWLRQVAILGLALIKSAVGFAKSKLGAGELTGVRSRWRATLCSTMLLNVLSRLQKYKSLNFTNTLALVVKQHAVPHQPLIICYVTDDEISRGRRSYLPATLMFSGWQTFYQMTGEVAATLTGLLFIVASLISGRQIEKMARGVKLFTTPTVFHFASVIVISGLALASGSEGAWPGFHHRSLGSLRLRLFGPFIGPYPRDRQSRALVRFLVLRCCPAANLSVPRGSHAGGLDRAAPCGVPGGTQPVGPAHDRHPQRLGSGDLACPPA